MVSSRHAATKAYKNVKCSLGSILLDPEVSTRLIEDRCLAVSKMAVKASHLCTLMVDKLLTEEEKTVSSDTTTTTTRVGPTLLEWPDFNKLNVFVQLFTKGCGVRKTIKPTPAIDATWAKHFERSEEEEEEEEAAAVYPSAKRFHSDYNLINYAAKTFQTAFLNNLRLNFINRQRLAVKSYLSVELDISPRSVPRTLIYALACSINGWKYAGRTYSAERLKEMEERHASFVAKHRSNLPSDDNNRYNYEKFTPVEFLRYYHFLKREYGRESTKIRNIPLVPKNTVKIHYVDFDAVGVKGLCRDMGVKPTFQTEVAAAEDAKPAKKKQEEEGWKHVFDARKINKMGGGGGWTFDRCVATDGVACSIRYYKMVTDAAPAVDRPVRRKRAKKNDGSAVDTTTPTRTLDLRGKRVIGVDPGRKNIAFCVELDKDTRKIVKKTKLTSKQYYCDSGYTRRKNRTERWLKEDERYKKINEKLSETTFGSEAYLKEYADNADYIWSTKGGKKWRREKFRVYCLKKKVLANFVNRVVGPTTPVHVAFGAAKFVSTGRGERYSSPSATVAELLKRRVGGGGGEGGFTEVDEWNTSKVCHRCLEPLDVVGYRKKKTSEEEEDKLVRLRGLRRCSAESNISKNDVNDRGEAHSSSSSPTPSTCPIGGSFLDRDCNAAANIANSPTTTTTTTTTMTVSAI